MPKIIKRILGILLLPLLLQGCAGTAAKTPEEQLQTLAVWDFENLSLQAEQGLNVGELLAAAVIERLTAKTELKILERQRLMTVLDELNLGTSSLAEGSTRLRIGNIIGAKLMIFGTFQTFGDATRVDVRLVEVETGLILKTAERTTGDSRVVTLLTASAAAAEELFDLQ